MDKLKKQIFIGLAMLLVAAGVALVLLLNGAQKTARQEEQIRQAAEQTTGQDAAQANEKEAEKAPAQPSPEEELAHLLDNETYSQVLSRIKTGHPPAVVLPIAITYITNKYNTQAIRDIREYQKLVEQIWLNYHPQAQQPAQPEQLAAAENSPKEEQPRPQLNNWKNIPCVPELLPNQNINGLSCRESDQGFCAFFENGRPYFCQTKDSQEEYLLNKWGSSVTVTRRGPVEKTFYYADGKLSRYTERNSYKRQVTQLWLSNGPLRMTQTDFNGKVLDKYYFPPNSPYIHYPGGNDMGEQNGPWEEKDGQIWTDGHLLLTLPDDSPAPDVCALFPGACVAQTQAR